MQNNDNQWQQFLESVRIVFEAKLDIQPHTLPPQGALDLFGEVLDRLREEPVERAIAEDEETGPFISRELRLFNRSVSEDQEHGPYRERPQGVEILNLRLDQAQTIKESIEDHVERLPGWAKKVLSVLNELLNLVKG